MALRHSPHHFPITSGAIPGTIGVVKGTIRERRNKDGSRSFECQVRLGKDPATGRWRFATRTAKTKREAQRLLTELLHEAASGKAGSSGATVTTLIETWLETGGPAGESTRFVYQGYIKLHVLPHLGAIPVNRLRVQDLERWYVTLREKGLAPASIRKAHNIVRAALTQAVRWGWVQANVAALARPPVVARPVVATPKPATVRKMLKADEKVSPEFGTYLRLAAITGARPGELLGLRWPDVEWAAGELHIRRRVVRASPRRGPDQDGQDSLRSPRRRDYGRPPGAPRPSGGPGRRTGRRSGRRRPRVQRCG